MIRGSIEDARRMLALIAKPGDVFELRGLAKFNGQQHVTAGYFDNIEDLAAAAVDRSGKDDGVYVTLNPVHPGLLSRAPRNQVRRVGPQETTSDREVRIRRSILIDVDPTRPTGISSTNEEHDAAIRIARKIRDELAGQGWPTPILADSGNGGHLIYAVELPVDDDGLVSRVLKALSARYSSPEFKIDEKVFNPARISKIYGTLTKKGVSTEERPHRVARILEAPDALVPIARELLEAIAPAPAPAAGSRSASNGSRTRDQYTPADGRPPFDATTWIGEHLPDAKERPWSEGRRWILPVCPFNDSHSRGEAYVTQMHSGAMAAGCLHESCKWGWKELRELYEPERARRAPQQNGQANGHTSPSGRSHEVIYEDETFRAEIDAIADRDRDPPGYIASAELRVVDPPPPKIRWKRAPDLVDEIWERKDDPWIGLRVGEEELVRVRAGGIAVVMGGSGSGKSSLVSNILFQHARDIGPAIALSIELPADELGARIVGIRCDKSWEESLTGQVPLEHMRQALDLPRMYVIEREDATIANLKACAAAAAADYPGQPILCAIDYAQLLHSEEREVRMRVTDAFTQIDRVSRAARMVSIAVSQMGREGARAAREGERLGIETADLGAETAAIERFATVTLTIGKMGEPREDGSRAVELSMGKARMGNVGDTVREMNYVGRSGLWRTNGEPKRAQEVRDARDEERKAKETRSLENQLLGACAAAKAPLSRNELEEIVVGGNRKAKLAAIAALIARGKNEPDRTDVLVEVTRRAPRSRSFMVWTPDRASAAGIALVKDMPLFGDDK